MVDSPTSRLHALEYTVLFDNFSSIPLNYDGVFSVKFKSISVVDFRHRLNVERNAAFDAGSHGGNPELVMEKCSEYMSMLQYLKDCADKLQDGKPIKINSKWNSSLVPGNILGPFQFGTTGSIVEEKALILMRWVAAAWRRAQDVMLEIADIKIGPPSQAEEVLGPTDDDVRKMVTTKITACLDAYRRAAGGAKYLGEVLSEISEELGKDNKSLPKCVTNCAKEL